MTRSPVWTLGLLGLVAAYGIGALAEYAATPLGSIALLDVRETLELARTIHRAALPPEPFYRAPLYAALLAPFAGPDTSDAQLLDLARIANLTSHLATTWLVFVIARRLWSTCVPAAMGAMLFGLCPVAMYFAGEAQDTSVALALFLGGVAAWLRHRDRGDSGSAAAAGALLALATLARPHYLPVLLAYFVFLAWEVRRSPSTAPRALGALACVAALLGVQVFANAAIGGEPRLLPWQGAYALWKANGEDANGRYFRQSMRVPFSGAYTNPARREAEALYVAATADPDPTRDEINRYWTRRTIRFIADDPARWMRLMASKAFWFANRHEQYNTRTYEMHKARQAWLRANPLDFGILATLAILALWRHPRPGAGVVMVVAISAVYAAGALVYFAGDRFRFPLAPLLAALAAGAFARPWQLPSRLAVRTAAALLAVVVVWWPPPRSLREETIEADLLLLASAANEAERYDEAHALALEALSRGAHEGTYEAACMTGFNVLFVAARRGIDVAAVDRTRAQCERAAASPWARHYGAILAWHAGDSDAATEAWRALEHAADGAGRAARASLVATGQAEVPAARPLDIELVFASALRGDAAACAEVLDQGGPKAAARLASLAALYRLPSVPCSGERVP